MAKKVMDDGGLVGDDIMIGLVRERLSHHDAKGRGYILDGFPRTVFQAQVLDEFTAAQPIDLVLDLDVPRELVLARLSVRRVCRDCGTNYVAVGVEKLPWICEVCGGDVMHRDDDTPEAIEHRLDLYREHVEAGADDELLQASLDEIGAVRALARDVAGGEPAARLDRRA